MSDKNEILAQAKQGLDKAAAEYALTEAVMKSLPDVAIERFYPFGYCAAATVVFPKDVPLASLIAQLTPLPCTHVRGSTWTIKPTKSLRDSDTGKREPVFPIINVSPKGGEAHARWWTEVAGRTLEIQWVMPEDSHELAHQMDLTKLSPVSYSYSTGSTGFWRRRMRVAKDLGLQSPMERWEQEWMAWSEPRHSLAQKRYVEVLVRQVPFLTEVVLFETEGKAPTATFGRGMSLTDCFSPEELIELQDFAVAQHQKLGAVRAEIAESLKKAEAWFLAFFASRGNPGTVNEEVFAYLFHKETGLAGSIHWARAPYQGALLEVGYTLDKEHIRVNCPSDPEAPAIDWDALAEYY